MLFVIFIIFGFITQLASAAELIMAKPGILLTYDEALQRCFNNSSLPFIPSSINEWHLILVSNDNSKLIERGEGTYRNMTFWVPATDKGHEGQLHWYNGSDASAAPINWVSNEPLYENSSDNNCVLINTKSEGRLAYMAPCTTKNQAMTCVKNAPGPKSTNIKDINKEETIRISTVNETTISISNDTNESRSKVNCKFNSLPWILVYCLGISTCVLLVVLIYIIIRFIQIKKDSSITQGSTVAERQELNVIHHNEEN